MNGHRDRYKDRNMKDFPIGLIKQHDKGKL